MGGGCDLGYDRAVTYQVLARSWRPQRFEEIVGQEVVVRTLQNAIASGNLGHAYLFSGLRGVGKTTAARLLAKAVNCESGPTPEPCGACVPCREIAAGSSLDVVELDGASNRGIDDVRELRELLRYRPSRDRYRVIIVDEVHMLTREAFNALLKSLEEPPPYILFVFATTEPHKVPATILSRCQQLEFRPVPAELIVRHLVAIAGREGFRLDPEAAAMIARAADGSVRDALSLTDQLRAFSGDDIGPEAVAEVLGVPPAERVVTLLEAVVGGDAAALVAGLREELSAGHDPAVLYRELGRALRAAALAAVGAVEPEATGFREAARRLAPRLDPAGWTRLLGLWLDHERSVRDAVEREVALEVACLRLVRWPAVARVERLLAEEGGGADPALSGGSRGTVTGGPRGASRAAPPAGEGAGGELPASPLGRALWEEGHRRLGAAVEAAAVSHRGEELVIRLEGGNGVLGRLVEEGRGVLEAAARRLWPEVRAVRVERPEAPPPAEAAPPSEVLEDPGVAVALEVFGGRLAGVRPEGEGWT